MGRPTKLFIDLDARQNAAMGCEEKEPVVMQQTQR